MFRLFRAFVNGRDLYQQSSVDVLENFKKSLRYSPDNQNGCIACSTHLESPLTEEDWRIIKNFIVEYEIKASITLHRGTAARGNTASG